ncbi:hypothetical protein IF2G_01497 [Cordyceps javanica]|nr:hypothetical protein IF2G_01497 [Cordyceps javanica]
MSRVDEADAADAPCQLTMMNAPMTRRMRTATKTMIGFLYREDAMASRKDAEREADLLAGRGPVSGWKRGGWCVKNLEERVVFGGFSGHSGLADGASRGKNREGGLVLR